MGRCRLCRTEHTPCYLAIAPVRPDRVSSLAVLNANCSEVNVAISRGDVHWKDTAFLGPDLPASSFPAISPHQSYIRSFGVHVMHLRPLHDRIIVQRLDEESTQRIGTIIAIQERSL